MRLVALLVLLFAGRAQAHDVWADGKTVPAWVRAACCSVADVHHLKPDQAHAKADGWHIDGFDEVIPYSKEEPSEDGDYWIFYASYPDGSHSHPYCFFVPPRSF